MDHPSDVGVVKIIISTAEYRRLLHIEKKFLELEQKYNSGDVKNSESLDEKKAKFKQEDSSKDKSLTVENQIGSGKLSSNLANFAKVVAQFMLKENNDVLGTEPSEFANAVQHSLQNIFGQTNFGEALFLLTLFLLLAACSYI